MATLLFELFSEEIPARMQAQAATHLTTQMNAALAALDITADCRAYVSPRHLAIVAENVPVQLPAFTTERKGPRVSAPDKAIDGFCASAGVSRDQLELREDTYFAVIHQQSRAMAEVVKPMLETILVDFPWPKSMRWGAGETRWVRPLHSMVCLLDEAIIPVEFAGLTAGNTTQGHRFLHHGVITLPHATAYCDALEAAKVMVDHHVRLAQIQQQANAAAQQLGLHLREDSALLHEVTGLVEWPVVLVGQIDAEYMHLPPEVLVSEMRGHQKYFALENDDGALSPYFLITANMETADKGAAIIKGNERVLRARLADGRFFWQQDSKKSLAQWAEGLKAVTYHAKLGSIADKVERMRKLAAQLTPLTRADPALVDRAIQLAKADLVTGMVGEFPELQGIMGAYYAEAQGEAPEVADALRWQYRHDAVPQAPVAVTLALADRLDTLTGLFSVGEKPTGSKDPFALRRAALSIIQIILQNNLRMGLMPLLVSLPLKQISLHAAHEKLAKKVGAKLADDNLEHLRVGKYLSLNEVAYQDIQPEAVEAIVHSLLQFILDRLAVQLKEHGIRHDVAAAVFALGDDDLLRIRARAEAVQKTLETEQGQSLLAAYTRSANILAKEEKKDKRAYDAAVEASLFHTQEERQLDTAIQQASADIRAGLQRDDVTFSFIHDSVVRLRPAVDAFFNAIMVNDENPAIRTNRLNLLASLRKTLGSIADFSKIEG